eukprot:TRINITY_DN2065_c0_g1_i1.p2 TRINITY_DN2065_c0_g1~~TRINITY_DN2065_c0_g1_i1.p2  ORF type:complete len:103 (-),score=7.93 TRINITY_DN2065_c0_g1_i1:523-831(-)
MAFAVAGESVPHRPPGKKMKVTKISIVPAPPSWTGGKTSTTPPRGLYEEKQNRCSWLNAVLQHGKRVLERRQDTEGWLLCNLDVVRGRTCVAVLTTVGGKNC